MHWQRMSIFWSDIRNSVFNPRSFGILIKLVIYEQASRRLKIEILLIFITSMLSSVRFFCLLMQPDSISTFFSEANICFENPKAYRSGLGKLECNEPRICVCHAKFRLFSTKFSCFSWAIWLTDCRTSSIFSALWNHV